MNLMKLICTVRTVLLGHSKAHRWQVVYPTNNLKYGAPMHVCTRCKTNGWMI